VAGPLRARMAGRCLDMCAGREDAGRVLARLGVAAVEGVVFDVGHVGKTKPRCRCLAHRILIAVGILGDTGNGMNAGPVPVVNGAREVRVVPVCPCASPMGDDPGCEHAHGMLTYDRAMRMYSRRGLERWRRRSWRSPGMFGGVPGQAEEQRT
jgi:hypothetical protein